eukprot:4783923-Pleurochrysis_carterae.AAC.1
MGAGTGTQTRLGARARALAYARFDVLAGFEHRLADLAHAYFDAFDVLGVLCARGRTRTS